MGHTARAGGASSSSKPLFSGASGSSAQHGPQLPDALCGRLPSCGDRSGSAPLGKQLQAAAPAEHAWYLGFDKPNSKVKRSLCSSQIKPERSTHLHSFEYRPAAQGRAKSQQWAIPGLSSGHCSSPRVSWWLGSWWNAMRYHLHHLAAQDGLRTACTAGRLHTLFGYPAARAPRFLRFPRLPRAFLRAGLGPEACLELRATRVREPGHSGKQKGMISF